MIRIVQSGLFLRSIKRLHPNEKERLDSAVRALIDNPEAAKGDGVEIEEVRWFSRVEMKAAVAADAIILPPTISVARAMINRWYGPDAGKDLIGGEAWRN